MADETGVGSVGAFWISAIQRVGLPTVAIVVVWWQVITPLKDGAIEQMKRQSVETEKQTVLIKTLTDNYGILATSEVRQVQLLQQISSGVQETSDRLQEHSVALDGIEEAVRGQ